MLYQIKNGTVSLGGETILKAVDFEIRGKNKIAVVGRNGAGKTTLLRLLAGELTVDLDDKRFQPAIWTARNLSIGFLHQQSFADREHTVEEEMLALCPSTERYAKERFDFEQEYDRIFTGFGFAKEEKGKKLSDFSGGEQTKIAFIKLLLSKPDLLLLDEPTNHLDFETICWLEEYLKNYDHAVVMVSHDRFFLDQVADTVYEVQGGKLTKYQGNYSDYKMQREKNKKIQETKYTAQQKEIARLNELITRFKHKPKKASMARSKKKVLDRMSLMQAPGREGAHIFVEKKYPARLGSKVVFESERLKIGYDAPLLELSLRIRRGQKIGIIGGNGVGKTTFLKTITEQIPLLSGSFHWGNGVEYSYFDQHAGEITSEERVFSYFQNQFPKLTIKEGKKILANYLFTGQDTGKKVTDLSGGEKARLRLAVMLEECPNLLLLDEPTNHMDIPAKETLESAFRSYMGTILFVSHDRYFLKEVADALLIFEDGTVKFYPFGYEHYRKEQKKKRENPHTGLEAVRAENALLGERLAAVPRGERMQSARFTTEQCYTDWQLSMSQRQLDIVKKELEEHLAGRENALAAYWVDAAVWENWENRCRLLFETYEKECLAWYEKWREYEEAFQEYRD